MGQISHSTSMGYRDRPCSYCTRFVGMTPDGSAARCGLPNAARVRSQPQWGCSGFEREIGADDEPGPPGGQVRAAPRVLAATTARGA
ncbi:MAG: hypothetical protein KGN16_12175 [Burkholderiales bacterium]|nr:hypothetical protein [Burkholderiales bacterium]